MSERFQAKKKNILERLALPDDEYTDCSPKGSIDEPIRSLVDEINNTSDFVTTSSCSGRIAVYLEGSSNAKSSTLPESNATSTGGKGGGRWLFTSHHPVDLRESSNPGAFFSLLGFASNPQISYPKTGEHVQFIRFKFESMILHILTSTPENAQLALNAALSAGFRESGVSSISSLSSSRSHPANPILAVRSSGLSIDSIIGFQSEDRVLVPMVSEEYLRMLVGVANERFEINVKRVERFRSAFLKAVGVGVGDAREGFEPAGLRRERLRREGLRRREDLRAAAVNGTNDSGHDQSESKSDEDESAESYAGIDLLDGDDPR